MPTPADIRTLQSVMAQCWAPLSCAWLDERPGQWLLRDSHGFTRRASSALPLDGRMGTDLTRTLDGIERWYAERGRRCIISSYGATSPDLFGSPLVEHVVERGYAPFNHSLVMTRPTDSDEPSSHVVATNAPSPAWWDLWAHDDNVRSDVATAVVSGATTGHRGRSPVGRYLEATDQGRTVGIAQIMCAQGWAGVYSVYVDPAARGRGLGQALVAAGLVEARRLGIPHAFLQVFTANESAIGLYRRLGWSVHHEYAYFARPE